MQMTMFSAEFGKQLGHPYRAVVLCLQRLQHGRVIRTTCFYQRHVLYDKIFSHYVSNEGIRDQFRRNLQRKGFRGLQTAFGVKRHHGAKTFFATTAIVVPVVAHTRADAQVPERQRVIRQICGLVRARGFTGVMDDCQLCIGELRIGEGRRPPGNLFADTIGARNSYFLKTPVQRACGRSQRQPMPMFQPSSIFFEDCAEVAFDLMEPYPELCCCCLRRKLRGIPAICVTKANVKTLDRNDIGQLSAPFEQGIKRVDPSREKTCLSSRADRLCIVIAIRTDAGFRELRKVLGVVPFLRHSRSPSTKAR